LPAKRPRSNIVARTKGKAMSDKPRKDALRVGPYKLADGLGFDLDRALKSVVTIQSSIPEDAYTAQTLGEQRTGSGVVIRESGLVLTIGYLITEAESVWIARADGRVTPGHALAIDQESGFGLIQALDRLDCPALAFGRSSDAKVGDPVIVAAGGGTRSVHAAIVAKDEFAGYWEYFLEEAIFSSPAHPFWGGAGAIDATGRLLGIGSLHVDQLTAQGGPKDINMIVPIDLLPPILDDLLTYGRVNKPVRPWLGIYSADSGGEVVVAAVADRSPAASAGLRRGDVLASVRGAEIEDLGDFYRKVWQCGAAGVEVPVEIIRDGRALGVRIMSADRSGFLKRPRLQ
jgi:S1-C subfamily serine protease